MFQWYRVMRIPTLALLALVGTACERRSLQEDAGGGSGRIGVDAAASPDGAPPGIDGAFPVIDGASPVSDARPPGSDGGIPLGPTCGMSTVTGGWVPMDFLVLRDRSPAGDQSKWEALLRVLTVQMGANERVNWGLYGFPKFAPLCSAGTVPPHVDIPVAPGRGNALDVAAGVAHTLTGGQGMPAAAAIEIGAAHLSGLAVEEPKFLLLVTDRAPSCAGTGDSLSAAEPAQARADAVAAITRAAAQGISTIVLAPSTTPADSVDALNALAEAGGHARSQGRLKFQDETTFTELFTPVSASTCVVSLSSRPPVVSDVTVTINDALVPRDTQHVNGWDYLPDAMGTLIEFHGAWCEQLLESRHYEVKAYYGCPVPIGG